MSLCDRRPRMPHHRRSGSLMVRLVLVVLVVAAAIWWLRFAPITAARYTVARGTISAEVMGTGTLEARTSAVVGSKIGGLITRVAADQGDRVKAGALLFELESSDIEQQVAMAEAEVAASTATLARLDASQRAAEAILAQARTNHARLDELISSMVVSQQDLDKAVEGLSVAEAELSIAQAAIIEGGKRLDASERSLEYQRARLQDTTIEAPFDGLVVRRDRDPGDVVAPAAAVLTVVSTDEMWITSWVDETELSRLSEGDSARVIFRSEPGTEYSGTVARIGREVDRETREVVVDVRVAELPSTWAIGQRAEVYIHVDQREAVAVLPPGLLRMRDGATGVLLDEDGRARWRELTLGMRGRDAVEISSGLSPGDSILIAPDLREGRRVTSE